MKPTRVLALTGVVLCGVLAVFVIQRSAGPRPPVRTVPGPLGGNDPVPPAAAAPLFTPEPSEVNVSQVASITSAVPVQAARPRQPPPQKVQATAPKKGKDPIKDPLARAALAWVGFDEQAEAYWIDAINDATLAPQERQDLIEDLNEDGISDPKHPTLADLPLILNRLDLIERLAPEAMDQVNAEAFMEAYKDLVNLANVTVGAGEPVR